MNLTIKYPNLPLRAYQKEQLETQIEAFQAWLTDLLGLSGVESAKRLVIASEALKEQCMGMGFDEIKKMFEMYADNKLNIEPRTNFFDRILLGKIVKEYRTIKKTKHKPMDAEQQKAQTDQHEIILIFDYYLQNKKINRDWHWVYSYLEEKKYHIFDKEEKIKKYHYYKNLEVQGEKLKQETQIIMCKISLLKDYFDSLIQKGKHIKQVI